jgi:arylsulfatase A-like enzyme
LRGSKLSLYEGGNREPLLVWWPGHAPAGRANDRTVFTAVDLLPTLCAIGGAIIPPDLASKLDGEDLSAALVGNSPIRRKPVFWEYGRNTNSFAYPKAPHHSPNLAVREGDWKLLINADASGAELYNLATDPKEEKNLAATQPEVTKRLSEETLNWRKTFPK